MSNWCEYVSSDGEIRNVLQFFCECEDLDETFTNLVSASASTSTTPVRSSGWERVLAVAQDRARVPWPRGARRVDLAWILAGTLLWMLRFLARRSTSFVQVVAIVAMCYGGLGHSHVRALRRRSNSQFHVAWLTLSVLGLYSRYRDVMAPTLSRTTDLMAQVLLLLMVCCYGHCCLVDPGREGGDDRPADEVIDGTSSRSRGGYTRGGDGSVVGSVVAAEDDAPDRGDGGADQALLQGRERRQSALLLRSGRCRICRHTFRLRDHHCVWVGQCVAERNRRSFLAFLVLFAGLSLWFSRRTAVRLAVGTLAPIRCAEWGLGCEEPAVLPFVIDHLLRRNLGGEDVAVALYASIAGFLAAGLAAQQVYLVSAGLTSLELRRSRKPRPSSPSSPLLARPNQDDSACGFPGGRDQTEDRSENRSQALRGHHYHSSSAPGPISFAPPSLPPALEAAEKEIHGSPTLTCYARRFLGNWARFLAGTEIPTSSCGEKSPRRVQVMMLPMPSAVVPESRRVRGHPLDVADGIQRRRDGEKKWS